MVKLWGGRFTQATSKLLEEFNASIPFDKKLWREDLEGSRAHAKMLHKIGVLEYSELDLILRGLDEIAQEIETGCFVFSLEYEDIHMAIETSLTQKIGEIGKKLHTARSRNDQVALDFRLYVLRYNLIVRHLIIELVETLLDIATAHTHTLMPGMTHLQHAQPVNFGFHLVAWICNFKRDLERLEADYKRHNFCPLGSGALAGTPYGNDREFLASELGFSLPTLNAMDSVSDRDFAIDMLYSLSMLMMHISRVAEEMVLWSSYEFRFIALSDAHTTGSSIMPQKKNPDIPELLRGKSGRVYGHLIGLLTTMKALPFAYNKDTQEDKEGVFDAVDNACLCLRILTECLHDMEVLPQNMLKMAKIGHLSATDLADFLVLKCQVPFRDAHHLTGQIVMLADKKGIDVSDLSEEEILSVDSRIRYGVKTALNLKASMNARNTLGGTSEEQTLMQIRQLREFVKEAKDGLQVLDKRFETYN